MAETHSSSDTSRGMVPLARRSSIRYSPIQNCALLSRPALSISMRSLCSGKEMKHSFSSNWAYQESMTRYQWQNKIHTRSGPESSSQVDSAHISHGPLRLQDETYDSSFNKHSFLPDVSTLFRATSNPHTFDALGRAHTPEQSLVSLAGCRWHPAVFR